MHELSLAENIYEITCNELEKHNKSHVKEIILEIGTLTCVEPKALSSALEMYTKTDHWKNVHLVFNEIKANGICQQCGLIFELEDFFTICPHCHSTEIEIMDGKEFKIKSLTME